MQCHPPQCSSLYSGLPPPSPIPSLSFQFLPSACSHTRLMPSVLPKHPPFLSLSRWHPPYHPLPLSASCTSHPQSVDLSMRLPSPPSHSRQSREDQSQRPRRGPVPGPRTAHNSLCATPQLHQRWQAQPLRIQARYPATSPLLVHDLKERTHPDELRRGTLPPQRAQTRLPSPRIDHWTYPLTNPRRGPGQRTDSQSAGPDT